VEYREARNSLSQPRTGIESTIGKAFLTAYLLTANAKQAETAVLEAVESWDPDHESEDVLFENVLGTAVRSQPDPLPFHWRASAPDRLSLPLELKGAFSLPAELRGCFVLRILVGMSLQGCAQLLRLNARRVEQYTRAALEYLAANALPVRPLPAGA
jgi:DNA-directed RNA polymerase specialized sigma24 family protein